MYLKMKPDEYWESLENELQTLKIQRNNLDKQDDAEQRRKLSKQIRLISTKINQHKKIAKYRNENPIDMTNTLIYKMFGKSGKELTPDEYREFHRIYQRNRRLKLRIEENHND